VQLFPKPYFVKKQAYVKVERLIIVSIIEAELTLPYAVCHS